MSNEKTKEQQAEELRAIEIPGSLNPWEAKQDRYTNTILGESAGTDFTQQTLSSLIRRDKDRLDKVQNRTCLVVDIEEANSYEQVVYNMNRTDKNEAPNIPLKKAYTRNAESKTYFVTPTWEYGESPFDDYQRAVMKGMHTTSLIEPERAGSIGVGNYIDQLYEDQTQDTGRIVNVQKSGIQNFPRPALSSEVFITRDGRLSVAKFKTFADSNVRTSTFPTPTPENSFAPGSLTSQVLDANWSPIYNPCAILRNDGLPTVSIGKNRFKAATVEEGGEIRPKPGEGSDFGPRLHPTEGIPIFHEGQDLKASRTDPYPIVAVQSGVITRIKLDGKVSPPPSQDQPTNLNICYVTINHAKAKDYPEALKEKGIEVHTTYMHLLRVGLKDSVNRLQAGDLVKAGDVIGFMGGGRNWPGSGRTTGPHLHFEIGVRKKTGSGFDYDEFKIEDGPNMKRGGALALGAVDPLHFNYPKMKIFSKNALSTIQAYRPVRTQEELERNRKETDTSEAGQPAQDDNSNQQEGP